MRRAIVVTAIVALLALPAVAIAAERFSTKLSGDAETPPVETDGSGVASVTISDDESEISFHVRFLGLSGDGTATMAHIHWGPADAAGPPILWLTEQGVADGSYTSPLTGTLTEADLVPADGGPQTFAEAIEAIRDGMTYVNVHTAANPGGEIRGQLRLIPDSATQAGPDTGAGTSMMLLLLALGGLAFAAAFRRLSSRPI